MRVPLLRPVAALCLCVLVGACTQPLVATPIPDAAPALGATDPTGPVQIVVWSSRALPEKLAAEAGKLPGVLAVGARGSAILDLRGAIGATRKVPRRPAGAVVPISVTSLTPALLRAFPDFKQAAAVLARGRAIVPRSAAEFRGIETGDVLVIAGAGHTARVRIGAVVEDGRIFRSELVLPAVLGRTLGIGPTRSLVLAVEPDSAPAAEKRLERAIGTFPARIRSGTGTPVSGSPGRQASLLELKKEFGEFWYRRLDRTRLSLDPVWREANIIERRVPVLGVVRCHRKMIVQLEGAMAEVARAGLAKLIKTYDGCYNPRTTTSNSETISRHAFGAAIDINARWNAYGSKPTVDRRIVRIMERWGFVWGGTWTVPDGMHFESTGPPAGSRS